MRRLLGSPYYLGATVAYGAGRKAFLLKDAYVESWDRDLKRAREPMLFSQKAFVTAVGAFSSIYLWPYYLYRDLSMLEIEYHMRDKSVYGYRRCSGMLDYILA